ncbi:MAG: SRPBCC family protein [Pseudomonadota bacterium]
MKLLKGLVIFVAVLVAAIVGIGFALPDTAKLERSIEINSPPATVFVILNSFKRFQEWSPWKKYDPNSVVSYGGPEIGVGAKMAWDGEQGSGSQEIIESTPYERVGIRLVFGGFENDRYIAAYRLEPVGATATRVIWNFDAQYTSMLGRYFGLMTDAMLGPDYEEGLANLKALVETLPAVDFSKLNVAPTEVQAQTLAYVSGTTTTDVAAISTAYAVAYSKVLAYLQKNKLQAAGAPVGIARKWDEKEKIYEYDAGIPVASAPSGNEGEIKVQTTYAGKALKVVYQGSYKDMGPTYDALFAYAAVYGYSQNGDLWEAYVSDPVSTPEAERVTHIYFPIK